MNQLEQIAAASRVARLEPVVSEVALIDVSAATAFRFGFWAAMGAFVFGMIVSLAVYVATLAASAPLSLPGTSP